MASQLTSKYCLIRSQMGTGHVMGLAEGASEPGTQVLAQEAEAGECEHQLWYEDSDTGTVRCKLNDLCVDFGDDDVLVVNPFDPERSNQQWSIKADGLENSVAERVVDVADHNEEPDAKLVAWYRMDNDNQQWEYEYQPVRYFFIKSRMHGKAVDIRGWDDGNDIPYDEKIIMFSQKDDSCSNQLWCLDENDVIRSKVGDLCLDSSDEDCIRVAKYSDSNPAHQWTTRGKVIVNKSNPTLCLDIKRRFKLNRTELCAFEYRGKSNQEWDYEYIPYASQ